MLIKQSQLEAEQAKLVLSTAVNEVIATDAFLAIMEELMEPYKGEDKYQLMELLQTQFQLFDESYFTLIMPVVIKMVETSLSLGQQLDINSTAEYLQEFFGVFIDNG